MQSYLQYRSLGTRLESQISRHRKGQGPSRSPFAEQQDLETVPQLDHVASRASIDTVTYEGLHLQETSQSLVRSSTRLANAMTGVHEKENDDIDIDNEDENDKTARVFVVGFEGPDDPLSPRNWSVTKRILYTFNVGIIALVVGMAASIDSAVIPNAAEEFRVSEIVEALATGLVSISRLLSF